jgi:hypothetical protein
MGSDPTHPQAMPPSASVLSCQPPSASSCPCKTAGVSLSQAPNAYPASTTPNMAQRAFGSPEQRPLLSRPGRASRLHALPSRLAACTPYKLEQRTCEPRAPPPFHAAGSGAALSGLAPTVGPPSCRSRPAGAARPRLGRPMAAAPMRAPGGRTRTHRPAPLPCNTVPPARDGAARGGRARLPTVARKPGRAAAEAFDRRQLQPSPLSPLWMSARRLAHPRATLNLTPPGIGGRAPGCAQSRPPLAPPRLPERRRRKKKLGPLNRRQFMPQNSLVDSRITDARAGDALDQ